MRLRFVFFVPLFALVHFSLCAKNPDLWNQFRGPNGSGIRKDTGIGVPSLENVLWKTPLPFGLSCPVLSDDKLFLTGFVMLIPQELTLLRLLLVILVTIAHHELLVVAQLYK